MARDRVLLRFAVDLRTALGRAPAFEALFRLAPVFVLAALFARGDAFFDEGDDFVRVFLPDDFDAVAMISFLGESTPWCMRKIRARRRRWQNQRLLALCNVRLAPVNRSSSARHAVCTGCSRPLI